MANFFSTAGLRSCVRRVASVLAGAILAVGMAACGRGALPDTVPNRAAIALSFDDRASIESWGEAREYLRDRGLRATFFVDRPDALSPAQIDILRGLADDGHEIGSHGFRHIHAKRAIESGLSVQEYLENEILPSIAHLERLGFAPRSFAYPHGIGTDETDRAVADHFVMIRNVSDPSPFFDGRNGPFVGAIYLDRSSFPRERLERLLGQARERNAVISLSAHKIGPVSGNYWCSYETLDRLAELARDHDMPFLTFSELAERLPK